jgi:UPF0755 protein
MLDTEPPKTRRRRAGERGPAWGLIGLVVFLVIVAGVVGPLGWFWHAVGSSGSQEPVTFTVASGATGTEIAERLEEQGIIRSALGFRLLAKVRGVDINYQAGDYPLSTNMSASAVLDAMRDGPVVPEGKALSFPEGLRMEEVAGEVRRDVGIPRKDFLAAARSGRYSLPPYLPQGTDTVEGFLFPNTYEIRQDATADDVINRLLAEFQAEVKDLPWSNATKLGATPYQVVVVASMIEREARFAQDRPKIAAVIYNRLEKDMPLQIDATVQYALGDWRELTKPDYSVDSTFNTYQHQGLPPGPICNPGLASIEAALEPAKANYLYYVVIDAQGHHGFTSSYQKFLELKDKYQG